MNKSLGTPKGRLGVSLAALAVATPAIYYGLFKFNPLFLAIAAFIAAGAINHGGPNASVEAAIHSSVSVTLFYLFLLLALPALFFLLSCWNAVFWGSPKRAKAFALGIALPPYVALLLFGFLWL